MLLNDFLRWALILAQRSEGVGTWEEGEGWEVAQQTIKHCLE